MTATFESPSAGGVGTEGPSAYEVWLDAGNVGDVNAFLASLKGPPGDPGTDAAWVQMTQAAYDALAVKDPDTLYVIIG